MKKENKVYIDQSKNVSKEMTTLKAGYRLELSVNQAFKPNKPNVSAYAVIQNSGYTKEERGKLETFLIEKNRSNIL